MLSLLQSPLRIANANTWHQYTKPRGKIHTVVDEKHAKSSNISEPAIAVLEKPSADYEAGLETRDTTTTQKVPLSFNSFRPPIPDPSEPSSIALIEEDDEENNDNDLSFEMVSLRSSESDFESEPEAKRPSSPELFDLCPSPTISYADTSSMNDENFVSGFELVSLLDLDAIEPSLSTPDISPSSSWILEEECFPIPSIECSPKKSGLKMPVRNTIERQQRRSEVRGPSLNLNLAWQEEFDDLADYGRPGRRCWR
ncbi:hypothetical protein P280DRAFT_522678 [Massarina eburnea CBS 473.64]|uniref:Uncharacterized protein n=1 Tax=Massarina eburnea CBS 473.64 TaxID=1395130 RepID=A0A6A6RMX2_9PLEO|nr:hypothetical protein P280DRAFT_522678 [Massarina eburnea CBS 473.64]